MAHPDEVTKEEIDQLILRKKEECRIFQENLKIVEEETLYAIDMEWFLLWKCFVTNDKSEKYLPNSKKKISINSSIGVLHPGPINNFSFFEKGLKDYSDRTLKKGLKKNEDYLTVSKHLWIFFSENYGGGPEFSFNKIEDIYSSSIKSNKDTFARSTKKSFIESEITSFELIENGMKEDEISGKQIVTLPNQTTLEEKSSIRSDDKDDFANSPKAEKILIHSLPSKQNENNNMKLKRCFSKSISPKKK